MQTNTHTAQHLEEHLVNEVGRSVTYSHNPYSTAANFNARVNGNLFSHLKLVDPRLRRVTVNSYYAAQLPMHENRQIPNCPRIFMGGMRLNIYPGVVEAFIQEANRRAPLLSPVKIIKMNTCRPYFLVSTRIVEVYEMVLACMNQRRRWVIPDDAEEVRRQQQSGEWRVKVSIASYQDAILTANDIDQEIKAFSGIAYRCPWKVHKNTGGVQLVLEPDHARRLLELSQCAIQDSDDALLFVDSESKPLVDEYMKQLGHDWADWGRVTCTPLRYVSVEDRR